MKRRLLILGLGSAFILAMLLIGSWLSFLEAPAPSTPANQFAQAGNYQVHFQSQPAPPHVSSPANIIFEVTDNQQQPVAKAKITVNAEMTEMGMAPITSIASETSPGQYQTSIQFTMSGLWKIQATIQLQDSSQQTANFEITAQ